MTLTVAEAAERVGRSERTIYRWLEQGWLALENGRLNEDELLLVELMIYRKRAGARPPKGL